MERTFDDVQTLIFCDETKFSVADGDKEDAIYYFGIAVKKNEVARVNNEIKTLLERNIRTKVFHSTSVFRESRPRTNLMDELTQVIIRNQLKCFCHKYEKGNLFEITKVLSKFNNAILNFNRQEFQALFYFLTVLNTYLSEAHPKLLEKEIAFFFDRNVYGVKETEAFSFPKDIFGFKQMTFTEKSNISLLSLPDFFGYLFRKSKISKDKADFGNAELEVPKLTIHAFKNLIEITSEKLFHFIEADPSIIEKALKVVGRIDQ